MSDEAEMLDGVKILLDRMEMFPEEFVSDNYGSSHKWNSVFEFGWNGVLTENEKKLLEDGLKKASRKVFSQRVAAHVLFMNDTTLEPPRPMKTPKAQNNTIATNTGGYNLSSTTSLNVSSTNNFAVRDKSGRVVTMHEHEYRYLMKQDPKRQESYLDWIKRGRPRDEKV